MSLKSRAILSIFITALLVGLAALIWAYQAGKITIFGSQQTSNVNYEVKGSELLKGTADANIDLSESKIKLKKGEAINAKALLKIIKNYSPNTELVQEPFVGMTLIGPSSGDSYGCGDSDPVEAFFLCENGQGRNRILEWLTTNQIIEHSAYGNSNPPLPYLIGPQPEIKFFTTDTGQEVGELYLEMNGQKGKYWGINLFDWIGPNVDQHRLYLVAAMVKPEDSQKITLVKELVAEKAVVGGTGGESISSLVDWYLSQTKEWLKSNKLKVYVKAKDSSESLGSPELIWAGQNQGQYLGYIEIRRATSTMGGTNFYKEAVAVALLTSQGTLNLKEAVLPNEPFPQLQGASFTMEEITSAQPEVKLITYEYPDQGIYQFSTGGQSVIKYNTFEPINENKPTIDMGSWQAQAKIIYAFSGSSDGNNWSDWSKEVEFTNTNQSYVIKAYAADIPYPYEQVTSPLNLTKYLPEGSKYFRVRVKLLNPQATSSTPSLDGFKINYDTYGEVTDGTPPGGTQPSPTGTTQDKVSQISKLVSTGAVLWFNILIALIVGGLISWLLLRKR